MGHYLVFTEVHSKDFSFNLLLIFQAALGAGKIHCLNFSKKLSSKMLCFFRNSFSDTHTKRVTTHSIHSFQQYLPLLVGSGHYFTLSLTSVLCIIILLGTIIVHWNYLLLLIITSTGSRHESLGWGRGSSVARLWGHASWRNTFYGRHHNPSHHFVRY